MKLGLALSGGGVRGVAHIGVLKALEENNIKIDMIGGTSSGGLIASLYAMDYKPEYIYNLFKKYSKDVISMDNRPILNGIKNYIISKRIGIAGISDGSKLEKLYTELAKSKNIYCMRDIKMPIVIPSIDLTDAKEYIFSNMIPTNDDASKYIGDIPVGRAVRASSSFPAFFCPCEYKNHMFLDGGTLNNVPANEVKQLGADKVISVNFEETTYDGDSDIMDIIMRALDIMGSKISENVLKNSDYILTIPTEKVGLLDDSKTESCFKYGYETAMRNMDQIKKVISERIIKLKYKNKSFIRKFYINL